jgi:hypothetical protein
MDPQLPDYLIKLNNLINMARNDAELRETLKGGDKESILSALKSADIYEEDLDNLNEALDIVTLRETMGFWRFGRETAIKE